MKTYRVYWYLFGSPKKEDCPSLLVVDETESLRKAYLNLGKNQSIQFFDPVLIG